MIRSSIDGTEKCNTPFQYQDTFDLYKENGGYYFRYFGVDCSFKNIDLMDHSVQKGGVEYVFGQDAERRTFVWDGKEMIISLKRAVQSIRETLISSRRTTLLKFVRRVIDSELPLEEPVRTSLTSLSNPNVFVAYSTTFKQKPLKMFLSCNLITGRTKGGIKRRYDTYVFEEDEGDEATFIEMAQTIGMIERNEI